ncbi:MAG: biopolymer transporter ExbD, partial [Planctomycetota bacterium]
MAQKGILAKIADEKHELEMTPMIDVTFLLLIFFMCTLKFKVLEGKLGAYLPKGGMHAITQSIYELAQRRGVRFHFERPVE